MLEAFQSLREELTTNRGGSDLALNLVHHLVLLLIWTYPLRDLELLFRLRIWMWTMLQHFLYVSDLLLIMHRIRMLIHPRNLLKRSQINLKNTVTLTVSMRLNPGLPRINSMMNSMNLGFRSRHKTRSRYVSSSS